MADTPERQLITSLLPPSTQLGMSREDFNKLNLEVLHMPGTEKSANAWVLFQGSIDYKRQSILFLDGRIASATCSWKLSSQGINDFERLKNLFVSASDMIADIEIGKRTKMKPQNNQIISVRDYLKDGFASSLLDRDLPVQNKPLDIKSNEIVKSAAVSEHPTSSTPWSIIVVLIVAATGLLSLLVKKRK
jgi:hypothetical protein